MPDFERSPLHLLRLVRLSDADESLVSTVLDHLSAYSLAVDGVPKLTDGARHFLTSLPPHTAPSRKLSFAVFEGPEPVGLVDLVDGYPNPATAFIGLLAIVESKQRNGFGRETYRLVEEFVLSHLQSSRIRLAVVATNPVHGFWRRMGFDETGEVRPYQGETVTSTVSLMEKALLRTKAPQ